MTTARDPIRALASLAIAAAAWLGAPPGARADLAPGFVGKLSVDTAFVTGAGGATDIAFAADGRALVTRKNGQIVVRRPNGTTAVIAYPFGGTLDTGSEKGLLGVVADPDVIENRAFYFYVSNGPTADKHRVYRAVLAEESDSLTVDPVPVIAASRGFGPGLEGPANHDGGGMIIHDDKLYVAVGDTGANASPPTNKYGSCLNKGNGKILRVNLDGTVPSDNPLVGLASVTACATVTGSWMTAAPDPRVYAWGFRNPWRMWVDPQTDLMFIGDVGEITQEEISIGGPDQHYGYPFEEGSQIWGPLQGMNCSTMTPSRPCTPPAFSYPRTQGQAITGGLIPEACGWNNVFDGAHYVWGDSSASWIRALPLNVARTGFTTSTPIAVATYPGSGPVSFRMGPDGSLYVVQFAFGAVYRFTPIDQDGATCNRAVPSGSAGSALVVAVLLGLAGVVAAARRARA
jgi:glucose/arabinose dehydrogenase